MLVYVVVNFLFLGCGGILLAFTFISGQHEKAGLTVNNIAVNLLLTECPLTAGVVNAIFMFLTFLISLPALALPMNRSFLKVQGWMVVMCSFFSLILGLFIWFDTLQTQKNLMGVWTMQTVDVQSLMQQRFNCCGYLNSMSPPFVVDTTCPDAKTAASMVGCANAFGTFANAYLDLIFTAAFGIVAVDVLLLLCIVMVLKYRAELERYRHIDEKSNF